MDFFKPIKRKFVPSAAKAAKLALPEDQNAPAPIINDTEVTELVGDDGWVQWQDSVWVDEFTNDALQTVPGRLE